MRHFVMLVSFASAVLLSCSVDAEIEYHFVPFMGNQPSGNAQFYNFAPVTGPQSFTVQASGASVGSDPSLSPTSAAAYLDRWGLGVLNPQAGADKGVQGQVQLDGKNGGEYLRFEYQQPVQITSLVFASVGLADRFELVADGQLLDMNNYFPTETTIRDISLSQGNWPGRIDFTQTAQPIEFAKTWDVVIYAGSGPGDGVLLENIGVEVPEPSTILLGLLGALFMGMIAYRRR